MPTRTAKSHLMACIRFVGRASRPWRAAFTSARRGRLALPSEPCRSAAAVSTSSRRRACRGGSRRAALRSAAGVFGFTLVEVLAALALMAIIIPVAMEGVQIASRAGTLGERKATAMRIAESLLNELIVTSQTIQTTASGSVTENGLTYPWTMKSETWSEDAMNVATVRVTFTVQGNNYDVSASTLYDPAMSATTATSSTATKASP